MDKINPKTGLDDLAKVLQPDKRTQDLNTFGGGRSRAIENLESFTDRGVAVGVDNVGYQEDLRAQRQSNLDKFANASIQAIIGTAGALTESVGHTFGILEDYEGVQDGITGMFLDMGKWLTETGQDIAPIYRTREDQQFDWSDLMGADFYMNQLANIGPTMALMIEGAIAAESGGLAAGAFINRLGRIKRAMGFVNKAEDVLQAGKIFNSYKNKLGAGAAAFQSRLVESSMESLEAYNDIKSELAQFNPNLSEEELNKMASEGAASVYRNNWMMAASDFFQFSTLKKVAGVGSIGKKGSVLKKATKVGASIASEGVEEGLQYAFVKEAKDKALGIHSTIDDYADDNEFWESVMAGMVGGTAFQAAGPGTSRRAERGLNKIKNWIKGVKDTKEEVKEITEENIEINENLNKIYNDPKLTVEQKERQISDEISKMNISDDKLDAYLDTQELDAKTKQDIKRAHTNTKKYDKVVESIETKGTKATPAQKKQARQIINTQSTAEANKTKAYTVDLEKLANEATQIDSGKGNKKFEVSDIQHQIDKLKDQIDGKVGKYTQEGAGEAQMPPKPINDELKKVAQDQIDADNKLSEATQELKELEADPTKKLTKQAEQNKSKVEMMADGLQKKYSKIFQPGGSKEELNKLLNDYFKSIEGQPESDQKEAIELAEELERRFEAVQKTPLLPKADPTDLRTRLASTEEALVEANRLGLPSNEINKLKKEVKQLQDELAKQAPVVSRKNGTVIALNQAYEAARVTSYETRNNNLVRGEDGVLKINPEDNSVPNSTARENAEFISKYGNKITEVTIEAQPYNEKENFGYTKGDSVQYGLVYNNTEYKDYPSKIYVGTILGSEVLTPEMQAIKNRAKKGEKITLKVRVGNGRFNHYHGSKQPITGKLLAIWNEGAIETPNVKFNSKTGKWVPREEHEKVKGFKLGLDIKPELGETFYNEGDIFALYEDFNGVPRAYPVNFGLVKDLDREDQLELATLLNRIVPEDAEKKDLTFMDIDFRIKVSDKLFEMLKQNRTLVKKNSENREEELLNSPVFKEALKAQVDVKPHTLNKGNIKKKELWNSQFKGKLFSNIDMDMHFIHQKYEILGEVITEDTVPDVDKTEEPEVVTTKEVTYKGNKYVVDMEEGTITNSKSGKPIKSTSSYGAGILKLAFDEEAVRGTEVIAEGDIPADQIPGDFDPDTQPKVETPPFDPDLEVQDEDDFEVDLDEDFSSLMSVKEPSQEVKEIVSDKELKWFKKVFPGFKLEVLESLRGIAKTDAWGVFTRAGVYLEEGAPAGTGYHEAMHVMTEVALTPEQRSQVLEMAPGDTITDKLEWLARQFADFKLREDAKLNNKHFLKRLGAVIYNFFNKIYYLAKAAISPNINSVTEFNYKLAYGIKTKHAITQVHDGTMLYSAVGDLSSKLGGHRKFKKSIESAARLIYKDYIKWQGLKVKVEKKGHHGIYKANKNAPLSAYIDKYKVDRVLNAIRKHVDQKPIFGDIVAGLEHNKDLYENHIYRELRWYGLEMRIVNKELVPTTPTDKEEQDSIDPDTGLLQSWQGMQFSTNQQRKLGEKIRALFRSVPDPNHPGEFISPREAYYNFIRFTADSVDYEHMIEKLEETSFPYLQQLAKILEDQAKPETKTQAFQVAQMTQMLYVSAIEARDGSLSFTNHNSANSQMLLYNDIKDLIYDKYTKEEIQELSIEINSAQDVVDEFNKLGYMIKLEEINYPKIKFKITLEPSKKTFFKEMKKLSAFIPNYYQSSIRVGDKTYYPHVPTSNIFKQRAIRIREDELRKKQGLEYPEDIEGQSRTGDPLMDVVLSDVNYKYALGRIAKVVSIIKGSGDVDFSKFNKIDHLKTMYTIFAGKGVKTKGFITAPILETSSTNLAVEFDTADLKAEPALELLVEFAEAERLRMQMAKEKKGYNAQYDINATQQVLFPFLDYSEKSETLKEQLEKHMNEETAKLISTLQEYKIPFKSKVAKDFMYSQTAYGLYTAILYSGDPAHFKGHKKGEYNRDLLVSDFFKRFKQVYSPGKYLDTNALVYQNSNGDWITKENMVAHIGVFTDDGVAGDSKLPINPDLVKAGKGKGKGGSDIYDANETVDETDAGVYIDPKSYLDRLKGLGVIDKWSDVSNEQEFLQMLRDPKYARTIFKPFIFYTQGNAPQQVKSSEVTLDPVALANDPKFRKILTSMGYDYKIGEDGKYFLSGFDWDGRMNNKSTREGREGDTLYDMYIPESAIKIGTNFNDVKDSGEPLVIPVEHWRKQQDTPLHLKSYDKVTLSKQARKIIRADLPPTLTVTPTHAEVLGLEPGMVTREYFLQRYDELMTEKIKDGYKRAEALFADKQLLETEIYNALIDKDLHHIAEDVKGLSTGTNKLELWHPLISEEIQPVLTSLIRNRVTEIELSGNSLYNVSSYGFKNKPQLLFNKEGTLTGMQAYIPAFHPILQDLVGKPPSEVKKVLDENPGLAEMLYYRTPTEGHYSMIRIVPIGVLPVTMGNGIVLPPEITRLAGLDFDIDKLLGLRYDVNKQGEIRKNDNGEYTIENKIFASLMISKYNTGVDSITPGNYDTLKEVLDWGIKNGLIERVSSDMILSSPLMQMDQKANMTTGAANIGVFANLVSYHALTQGKNLMIADKEATVTIMKDGKPYTYDAASLDRALDEAEVAVMKNIAELSAQAVDNGKDPIAEALNINAFTAPMLAVLLKMGVPLTEGLKYLLQPNVKALATEVINAGGRDDATRQIFEKYGLSEDAPDFFDFDLTVDPSFQLIVDLHYLGKDLTKAIRATRFADSGAQYNYATVEYAERNALKPDIKYLDNIGNNSGVTAVGLEYGLTKAKELLNEYIPYNREIFNRVMDKAMGANPNLNAKNINKIYKATINYLISKAIPTDKYKLLSDPEFINKFNTIIKAESPLSRYFHLVFVRGDKKAGTKNRNYIGTYQSVKSFDLADVKAYWLELKDSHPEFAKDLAIYGLLRNGLDMTPDSFGYMIPSDILNEIFDLNKFNLDSSSIELENSVLRVHAGIVYPTVEIDEVTITEEGFLDIPDRFNKLEAYKRKYITVIGKGTRTIYELKIGSGIYMKADDFSVYEGGKTVVQGYHDYGVELPLYVKKSKTTDNTATEGVQEDPQVDAPEINMESDQTANIEGDPIDYAAGPPENLSMPPSIEERVEDIVQKKEDCKFNLKR